METKKCLLFIRTSTSRQETESQLKETKEYAESLGYNDFVVVGDKGFSAYKVSDEYLALLEQMKETVLKDREIKAVVCWAMNRLFRNISVANELKEWFVENKVQLEIKEPHIRLLEPDGTLSDASEMLFHFFAVYNKQQISELRKKAHRAKTRDKSLHKFLGGKIKYGYRVDDNKQVVENPETASIVREIFNIYTNQCHSYPATTKEINERRGLNFTIYHIKEIITCSKYYDETTYPAIITEKAFKDAETVRNQNNLRDGQYKNRRFANRLIKCPVCGMGYTASTRTYRCADKHCKSPEISIARLDALLWLIASHLEGQRLVNASSKEEFIQKKAVLASKIKSVDNYTSKGEKRAERAKKMALSGLLEIEEYKSILEEVKKEQVETLKKVEGWKSEIAEIDRLINEDKISIQRILDVADDISSADEQEMKSIVRKWIKRIAIDEDMLFTIETLVRTYKCLYKPSKRNYCWYTISGRPLLSRKLVRYVGKCFLEDSCGKKDPYLVIHTTAWLNGSEII